MRLKIFYILIFITFNLYSQKNDFEGYVIYEIIVKNPNPELVSDSLWNAKFANKKSYHKYFYKGKKYKNVVDNKSVGLYSPSENKIYNFNIEGDTIFINSLLTTKSIDPVKTVLKGKKTKNILDYECDELIIESKYTKTTYYYSDKFYIPAANFKNHHYGNWFEYLEKTNSLPLKIIIKSGFLFMEMTAIDVKEIKLDDSEFDLDILKN